MPQPSLQHKTTQLNNGGGVIFKVWLDHTTSVHVLVIRGIIAYIHEGACLERCMVRKKENEDELII